VDGGGGFLFVEFEHTVNEGDEFVVDGFFRGVVEVNGVDGCSAYENAGKIIAVTLQVGAVVMDKKVEERRIQ
jgi:hypothetical protein